MRKILFLLIFLFVIGLMGPVPEYFNQGTVFAQSADEAVRLYQQGQEAYKYGRYQEALDYFERSLKINRSLKNLQGISANLNEIGVIYFSLGQYDKALTYYEESLKIRRDLKIPQDIAMSLNNIGGVYKSLGQYQEALKYYDESLKIRRDLKIPQAIATSLNNIGIVYKSLGQYQEALKYYDESLKIYKELKIPQDIATSLNNIGVVYESLGQYDKALTYHDESLKIRRQLKIPQDIATSLNNIGVVYDFLDQYDKGLTYHDESLKIYKELKIPQDIAISLNNIGGVYKSLGQYDKALTYYEESLKIRRDLKIPQDIATSLNNIGGVYDSLGQYDKGLTYHDESLKIRRQLKIPQDIATSLNDIGGVYLSQKRYKSAEESFLEADKERAKTGTKWKRSPGLVEVYLATGGHNEALKLLKDMTPEWNTVDSYKISFHTQHGLALKGSGNFKEASAEFLKAVSITEEMRQKVKGEKTGFLGGGGYGGRIRSYKGLVATLSERAIGCMMEDTRGKMQDKGCADKDFSPYGKDLPSAAFYFAESTKARTLLEAMAESARKSQRAEIPEELREKEQSLLSQLSAIENQWDDAYKRGEDVLKRLKERKEGLIAEFNNLITELRQKYPRYAALNYPKPIPPEELPLKDNEVLLEYAIGDDAGYLFVVRKGGVKRLIRIPVTKEALEEKIKAFMEPMNMRRYERFSIKEAKAIYDMLLSEALKEIKEDEKIIIVPDGILGLLPFEALVVKEGISIKESLYVGDRYTISYYQSATVLALQRKMKDVKTEKTLFALGNPVYSREDPRYIAWKENKKTTMVAGLDKYPFRGISINAKWGKTTDADTTGEKIEFPPLPETEIEIKEIARIMDVSPEPPDILLSVIANETELRKTGLERYRYIHFATHASLPGMIQGLNEPFILLGQVENKDKDDGFLTLSEVLDLRLNADMVVLSACVTGVGKEVEGEGVANFARAFQHAGAGSVVVSLWEVASQEAVEYMKTFYGYLKAGKSRSEAMRLARNEIKARYLNPFFWAVFILHGEG